MTKAERRAQIKAIYPVACTMDPAALIALAMLVHPPKRHTRCSICGCPITTELPRWMPARCKMHDRRRVSMKGKAALEHENPSPPR